MGFPPSTGASLTHALSRGHLPFQRAADPGRTIPGSHPAAPHHPRAPKPNPSAIPNHAAGLRQREAPRPWHGEDGRGSLPTGLLGNPARSLCMPCPRTACSRRVQCPPLAARCLGARWTIREGVCSCIPRTEPNSLPEPGARPSGGDGSGAPAPGSGIKAPSSAHNGRLRAGPGQLRGHVPALAAGGETPAQKGFKGDKTVLKSTAKVRQNSQKMGGNKKKTPPKGGFLNRKKWWKKGA